MKKTIVLVLVALICVSAVFASKDSIRVSVVPYGFQISTSSESGVDAVKSRYGIGLNAAWQHQLPNNFVAETGLAWNTFLMPDSKPAFTNILAFVGVGYTYAFNDKFACTALVDLATDTLIYNSKVSENFTLVAGLDASYAITDSLKVLLGCKGTFGFAKKDAVKYVNYRILPELGVGYNF